MKEIISLPVIFSICCLAAMPNRSDAQAIAKNSAIVKSQTLSEAMKLNEDSKNEITEITYVNEVNQKALHDFNKTYKDINNEKWYRIKNGLLAEFSSNSSKNRVVYDNKGNWRFTVSYYEEKNLPVEIRAIVKTVYYDYTISRIEEVHVDDKVIYVVHVQNNSSYITLRVCEGEMNLIEDFRKSE